MTAVSSDSTSFDAYTQYFNNYLDILSDCSNPVLLKTRTSFSEYIYGRKSALTLARWKAVQKLRSNGYFDLSRSYKENNGNLSLAFKNSKIKYCIISFSTDWLYPTSESKKIVIALNSIGAEVSFVNIVTNNGHDSFLVNEPKFLETLKGFLDSSYEDFKNEN